MYKTVEFNMIYALMSIISFVAIYALLGGPALTINSWLGDQNQFIEPGIVYWTLNTLDIVYSILNFGHVVYSILDFGLFGHFAYSILYIVYWTLDTLEGLNPRTNKHLLINYHRLSTIRLSLIMSPVCASASDEWLGVFASASDEWLGVFASASEEWLWMFSCLISCQHDLVLPIVPRILTGQGDILEVFLQIRFPNFSF